VRRLGRGARFVVGVRAFCRVLGMGAVVEGFSRRITFGWGLAVVALRRL
jgi:hypothetical protein